MVLELPDKRGIVAEVSAMSRAVVVPRQASPLRSREAQESAGCCRMHPGLADADALDAVRPVSDEKAAVHAPGASVPQAPEQSLKKRYSKPTSETRVSGSIHDFPPPQNA